MISIQYLQPDDIIEPNDLVRARYWTNHESDSIDWENVNKICDWKKAKDFMPPWVGKTIRQFSQGNFLDNRYPIDIIRVENRYITDITHILHEYNCITNWKPESPCNCKAKERIVQ